MADVVQQLALGFAGGLCCDFRLAVRLPFGGFALGDVNTCAGPFHNASVEPTHPCLKKFLLLHPVEMRARRWSHLIRQPTSTLDRNRYALPVIHTAFFQNSTVM